MVVIWKERPMPSCERLKAERRVMSWPSNTICPELGGSNPLIRLNRVVLPAPFGPIMLLNSPWRTASETLLTATLPPKARDRSTVSKMLLELAMVFLLQIVNCRLQIADWNLANQSAICNPYFLRIGGAESSAETSFTRVGIGKVKVPVLSLAILTMYIGWRAW